MVSYKSDDVLRSEAPRLAVGDIDMCIHAASFRNSSSATDLAAFVAADAFRPCKSRLSADELVVYQTILKGFLSFASSVEFPMIDSDRVGSILCMIQDDYPEVFWVESSRLISHYGRGTCTLMISYWMKKGAAVVISKRMKLCANRIQRKLQGLNEFQRQLAIHDFLVSSVSADGLGVWHSHMACGPLVDGQGVCDGLARAYKYLADRCGVRTMVARGVSSSEAFMHKGTPLENNDEAESGGHAWNITQLNGTWYHQDIMYDTCSTRSVARYDYFGLSDEEIALDHMLDEPLCTPSEYPKCPKSLGYYRLAARYITSENQLKDLFIHDFHHKIPSVFQLPASSTADVDKTWNMVLRIAEDVIEERAVNANSIGMSADAARAIYEVRLDAE